ncbi:hypothetical protein HG535_0E04720 [Zygotorulaspora mrakii]|uniref:Uncharacterized protein n=1 Tax=Zygotorulaspora mrakii TaxID=42260 RepID=A0A7H9B415_ZYGMR|nr:uncharacterized protein HG535_0E04720 [Zygotorulaspora mrakii]QLG73388.1 hypothetical protein HG535_0E04720 [Zygotorulaspora mrakii]
MIAQPYMMYPPPPMANANPGMYPIPMPIYPPGPSAQINSKQTFPPAYMTYLSPNQMPFPYNQSTGYPTAPMHYGMCMPPYSPNDLNATSHPDLVSHFKPANTSRSSVSSLKSRESFTNLAVSSAVEIEENSPPHQTDVSTVSNELKELSL